MQEVSPAAAEPRRREQAKQRTPDAFAGRLVPAVAAHRD
jgi:hypothetical protein